MNIIETKVKPERDVQKRDSIRVRWWQYAEKRPGLVKAIESLDRVLIRPRTSKHNVFTFLPSGYVYSENLVVFALSEIAFPIIHSRTHEVWTTFTSSTLEDRQGYRPSDCFETFPFPENWETNPELESIGQEYYEFRLDYEDEEPSDIQPTEGKRQRKKPWRYRWPEATHDEVLARLLELNQHRHEAEILGGKQAEKKAKKPKAKGTKAEKLKGVTVKKQLTLIPPDVEQLDMF